MLMAHLPYLTKKLMTVLRFVGVTWLAVAVMRLGVLTTRVTIW